MKKPRFILPDLQFARETGGETLSLTDRSQNLQINFAPTVGNEEGNYKFIAYRDGRFLEQVNVDNFESALSEATQRYNLPKVSPYPIYSHYYNIAHTPLSELPLYVMKDRIMPDQLRVIYDSKSSTFYMPTTDELTGVAICKVGSTGEFGADDPVLDAALREALGHQEMLKFSKAINDEIIWHERKTQKTAFLRSMMQIAEEMSRALPAYDPEKHKDLPPPVGYSIVEVLSAGVGGYGELRDELLSSVNKEEPEASFADLLREKAGDIKEEIKRYEYEHNLEAPTSTVNREFSNESAQSFIESGGSYDDLDMDVYNEEEEDDLYDTIVGQLYSDAAKRSFGENYNSRFGIDPRNVRRANVVLGELLETGIYVPPSDRNAVGYFDDAKGEVMDAFLNFAREYYPVEHNVEYDLHEKFYMEVDISPLTREEYDGSASEDTWYPISQSNGYVGSLFPLDSDEHKMIVAQNYDTEALNVLDMLGIDPKEFAVWHNNTIKDANNPDSAADRTVSQKATNMFKVVYGENLSPLQSRAEYFDVELKADELTPEAVIESLGDVPGFADGFLHVSQKVEAVVTHGAETETFSHYVPIADTVGNFSDGVKDDWVHDWLSRQLNDVRTDEEITVSVNEETDRFYRSVVQEAESTVGGFNSVTLLTYMDVEDAIALNKNEEGVLHVPAGTFIGLYDGVSGGGSVMEIDIPGDGIDIDLSKYRATACIASEGHDGLYGIDQVYGFSGEAFLAGADIEIKKPNDEANKPAIKNAQSGMKLG